MTTADLEQRLDRSRPMPRRRTADLPTELVMHVDVDALNRGELSPLWVRCVDPRDTTWEKAH